VERRGRRRRPDWLKLRAPAAWNESGATTIAMGTPRTIAVGFTVATMTWTGAEVLILIHNGETTRGQRLDLRTGTVAPLPTPPAVDFTGAPNVWTGTSWLFATPEGIHILE